MKCMSFEGDNMQTHSFLMRNNKYLMIVDCEGSNVYDIKNDKWLLDSNNGKFYCDDWYDDRAILISDDILALSSGNTIEFYFVGKMKNKNVNTINTHDESQLVDQITSPKYLTSYDIKYDDVNAKFENHGMVCTNLNIIDGDDDDNKNVCQLKFNVVLFGVVSRLDNEFLFVDLGIMLSYNYNYNCNLNSNTSDINSIKKTCKLDVNENVINIGNSITSAMFGYDCVYNWKNEAIIVIIGGVRLVTVDGKHRTYTTASKTIYLFNTVTHKIESKPDVKF